MYDPSKLGKYLKTKPDADNKELYSLCNATTPSQKGSIRKLKSRILEGLSHGETDETNTTKSTQKSPSNKDSSPHETTQFIDDPDELLMSVAVRELNKPNPDPRWATILINCKKENIAVKDEVIDQLQKLPTRNLTEILQKQHIKSWQTE